MPASKFEKAPKKITVRAVLDYVDKLREEGDRLVQRDVYASPYRPSPAYARKLSQQLGPEAAITELRKRAAMHAAEARETAVRGQQALARHIGRQKKYRETRHKERGHLSAGTRIDQAIARMSLIASPASSLVEVGVHGGEPDHAPKWVVDAADKARRLARACCEEIEALEDQITHRDLEKAA